MGISHLQRPVAAALLFPLQNAFEYFMHVNSSMWRNPDEDGDVK